MNSYHLKQAARHLAQGNIIAYPTEAVYGLGCDPFNETAIKRLLAIKQRPWHKGLILIAANYAQLAPFLQPLSPLIQERVAATWPGPVTWLLPANPKISKYLRGRSTQLAVRVTAHPLAAALCQQWQGAIVSTSANLSTHPPARTAFQVRRHFLHNVDYILSGKVGERLRPSEIRDALTNRIIRV